MSQPSAPLPAPDLLTEQRDRLLLAVLPEVAFDGWSNRSLKRAAETIGVSVAEAALAFPGGAIDLVAHFSDWADRAMLARLAAVDLQALKIRARVTLALRSRLEALAGQEEAVSRAAGLLALPANTGLATRLLHRTVDLAWYAAGDQSVDFNHYSKRALLAGVQAATLLYWLNDASEGHADSWAFLDRRIASVMTVGRGLSRLKPPALPQGPQIGAALNRALNLMPSPSRFVRHLRRG